MYKNFHKKTIQLIIVGHVLPDTLIYYDILNRFFDIVFLIPKPNSINPDALDDLRKKNFPILKVKKEDLKNKPEIFLSKLKNKDIKQFCILDTGGYFAPLLDVLTKYYGKKFLGIIEDTENGWQKYEQLKKLHVPVFSVARSPLKNTEDYLVGQSIVFSAEYVLRMNNSLLNNKNVGVIGFGKIGRSIAQNLFIKNIKTLVFDNNPQQRVQAHAYGYEIPNKKEFFKNSSIIFCATGNGSLHANDFEELNDGTYVASVTSSDDEMHLNSIKEKYSIQKINEFTDLYQGAKNYFYLLNKGNAINFLHNSVVGAFIYLVQGEIVALIASLIFHQKQDDKIQQATVRIRDAVATKWIQYFLNT